MKRNENKFKSKDEHTNKVEPARDLTYLIILTLTQEYKPNENCIIFLLFSKKTL